MRKGIIGISAVLVILASCKPKEEILMTVGKNEVSKSEFEQIFFKNYKKDNVDKKDLDEYIDLFVKFKLKVTEAESRGMDTTNKFKRELKGYRDQIVKTYMVDKEMNETLMKEAYDRMMTEVRASHIMVKCAENAHPDDTLIAYNKAMKIKERLQAGEDFETVAKGKGGSEDPSAQQNGGDLGFFRVFSMVYPFESAAYNMNVNDLSNPVRTKYGYHIIKKTDMRDARGDIKVAHIMIRINSKDKESVANGKKKIDEIYQLLQDGGDFEQLAKQHSDDKQSAVKGGELPMFGSGKMVPVFEEESFYLKNNGDISKPFKTEFGWHIVKRLDYKPIGSYDEMESFIKSRVKRDTRSNRSKTSFIMKLKKEYDFKDNSPEIFPELYPLVTDSIFEGRWNAQEVPNQSRVLFQFADTKYTLKDFCDHLIKKQRKERARNIENYVNEKYKTLTEAMLIEHEDSRLEEKYVEFRALMKEYRDGILLFEITDQEVWGKAQKDTTGLKEYHAANRELFMWEERVTCEIYKCVDNDIAIQVKGMLDKGIERDSIMKVVNAESNLNVKLESGTYERSSRDVLKDVHAGVSQVIPIESSFYVVKVTEELEPTPKSLREARGPIISKYQEYLEENWLKELRGKYPVTVNEKVLYSVKKPKAKE